MNKCKKKCGKSCYCKKEKETSGNVTFSPTLNLEIDYDKLAEAIVQAQQPKHKHTNRVRGAIMGALNAMLYFLVGLFSILAIIGAWIEYADSIEAPVRNLGDYIVCTVLLAVSTLLSIMCGVEAIKDNDESAQDHFNSLIAVIALIVSLVALYRG